MKVLIGLIQGLALLILVSCEEPGTIGVDVDPDNLTFNTIYKKFNLSATLVQTDSVITGNSGRLLVGRYQNPEFGTVETKSYFQVWSTSRPVIADGAVYDSLSLVLPYSYVNGTQIFEENTLEVYRLEEDLASFATYYNSTELQTSTEPIGVSPLLYPTQVVNGDEVIDLDTAFSMRLSDVLGQEIFDKAVDENDSTFESLDNWLAWFKGLSLEAGEPYLTVTGFNQGSTISNMVLYYHSLDENGDPVNSNHLFSVENSAHLNNIQYDRSGSALADGDELYTEFDAQDGFIYTQAGTGLSAKIDFAPYIAYVDSIGDLLINYGVLTIGEVEPFTDYTGPPATFVYFYTDSTNRRLFDDNGIPRTIQQDDPFIDASGTQVVLSANFIFESDEPDEYVNSYSNSISNTLQAMADGRITDDKILTGVTPPIGASSVNGVKIDPLNITLEVYYTTSKSTSNE